MSSTSPCTRLHTIEVVRTQAVICFVVIVGVTFSRYEGGPFAKARNSNKLSLFFRRVFAAGLADIFLELTSLTENSVNMWVVSVILFGFENTLGKSSKVCRRMRCITSGRRYLETPHEHSMSQCVLDTKHPN